MELNQQSLRGILAAITSVNEAFIVPKQGNWWNPQEKANCPDTYLAYIIRRNRPRTLPFYNVGEQTSDNVTTKVNGVTTLKIATIDLQFVGPQAESLAQNVCLWPLRSDVIAQFKRVNGSLLPDGLEAVSSNFYQDGNNNVIAWNVTMEVLWYQVLDTNQGAMPDMTLNGVVTKRL